MKKLIVLVLLAAAPSFAWNPFRGKSGFVISVCALAVATGVDYGPKTTTIPGLNGHLTVVGQTEYRPAVKGISVGAVVAEVVALRKHSGLQAGFTAANWAGAAAVGAVAYSDRGK